MTDSPAATVAAILRHIETCRKRTGAGPAAPKVFREDNRIVARVLGTGPDGAVEVAVVNRGYRWKLATFGAARGLLVAVRVDPGAVEAIQ